MNDDSPPIGNGEESSAPERGRWALSLAAIAVFLAVFHWNWFVLGRPLHTIDWPDYFFPFSEMYRSWMARGIFPLWTDSIFLGFPIGVEGQFAAYHPLQQLLLRSAGTRAVGVWLYLHSLLAAYGMVAYCRSVGRSKMASLLAGAAYSMCGISVMHVVWPNIFAAGAWVPLELWAIEKIIAGRRPMFFASALAGASGFQWLSGHPQIPVLSAYCLAFYCLLRAAVFTEMPPARTRARPILLTAAGLAAGFAMGMVQILPLFDVAAQSWRSQGTTSEFAATGSLPPWGALLGAFPALYGTEGPSDGAKFWLSAAGGGGGSWELHFYTGALFVSLAFFAVVRFHRDALVKTYIGLAAVCLLYAFGKWGPLFPILRHLPGLAHLRVPARALLFVDVALIGLGALAIDRLRGGGAVVSSLWRRTARIPLFCLLALWVGSWAGVRAADSSLTDLIGRHTEKSERKHLETNRIYDADSVLWRMDEARRRAESFRGQIRSATSLASLPAWTNLGSFACSVWGVWWWLAGSEASRRRRGVLLAALLLADLLWFGWRFGPRAVSPAEDPRRPPPYASLLEKPARILSLVSRSEIWGHSWDTTRRWLPASMNAAWDIDSADGYSALIPPDFWTMMGQYRLQYLAGPERLRRVERGVDRLRLFGVTHVLSQPEWGDLPWALVYADPLVRIWKVPDPLPRAFLSVQVGLADSAWRDALLDAGSSPVAAERLAGIFGSVVGEVAAVPQTTPDEAIFEIEASEPSTFVRSTRFVPGWRASLDGVKIPVQVVLGFFQGVRVPAGRHLVKFEFRPPSLRKGAIVSAAFSLLILGTLLCGLARRR